MKNEPVTKKQIEIFLFLYTFRSLHTYQFQKLLNHKKPNQIKVWLKDLTEKGYLTNDYNRHSIKKNTKPAVYSLTKKARHILKTKKECDIKILNKIYREAQRTETFKSKCLLIADIYISLQSQLKNNESLYFATQTDLSKHDYLPDRLIDAYVAITKAKATKRYFIEIIDDKLSKPKIRAKVRKYMEFESSGQWEGNNGTPFPTIIFVCPNEQIKKWLQRAINKKLEEEQSEINFLTSTTLPML